MWKRAWGCLILLLAILNISIIAAELPLDKDLEKVVKNIHWLGQSSIKITGDVIIYLDPFVIKEGDKADIILVTHSHADHFSLLNIKKLQKPDTALVLPADCYHKDALIIKPGQTINIKGIEIETVPAYNLGKDFHPKSKEWVGYIITWEGKRIYMAGDTDRIPEMKKIKADIVLLPVGGTYTMTPEEAAQAVLDINPKVAIPIHYGNKVGTPQDGEKFKTALQGKIKVIVKEIE